MAPKSNEEQIEELKAEAKQAWSDAKDIAGRSTSGALRVWRSRPLPYATRAAFFAEFGKCLEAGLPLSECFAALSDIARSGDFALVLDDLQRRCLAGEKLWVVMRDHGNAFEAFELALVECGMRTGHAAGAFHVIAEHLRAKAEIAHQVIGDPQRAPILLAMLFALVVVPLSASGFLGFVGAALQTAVVLTLVAATAGGTWLLLRSRRGARHRLLSRARNIKQFLGPINDRAYADFFAAVAVGRQSGLPLERTLGIAALATDDGDIQLGADAMIAAIGAGKSVEESARSLPRADGVAEVFAADVADIVAAASEAGRLARDRFVKTAGRSGKIAHYATAAAVVVVAWSAGSNAPAPTAGPKVAADTAGSRHPGLEKTGGKLHKRLTGQGKADERARKALGER